jgi:arylsulfatase A-like enzyme
MRKHGLKIFLGIVIAGLITAGVFILKNIKGKDKDFNIILISIDTLRADHLGCYNYPRNTSPSLDKFRGNAVLFRCCIAQSSSTLTSHASMLTSLIPSHHGAFFVREQALPDNSQTMAELLKQKGYRTISFNDGGQIAPKFGLNQGFDRYESMSDNIKAEHLNFYRVVTKTMTWLDQHPNEKFFLFLHTYETHHPYTPKKRQLKLFESNYNGDLNWQITVEMIEKINKGEIKLTDEDKQHIINTYDAEIRSMDESFGLLIRYLKEKKLYDNTLIIFTSDHGEEFGEHGIWATHSHTLFNDQLHVPLLLKLPGSKFAARKVDHLVRSIDILPTVLDLLGEKMSKDFEGSSLVPLMKGIPPKKPVFAISQRDMQQTYVSAYWSIMTRKWKLYDSKLYDLLNDPGELKDIAGSHEDLKTNLQKYALKYIKRKKAKISAKKVTLDDELREKLKSLGYLD